MNWKMKAYLQSAVSMLPAPASHRVYYGIQRAIGTLRAVEPTNGFRDGLRLADALEAAGGRVAGATFLEVGTGRRINVPIALWLCGAGEVITVDRTPYLRPELVEEELGYVRRHASEVEALFGARADRESFRQRFAILLRENLTTEQLLAAAGIRYLNHDVRSLPMPAGAVDYHISNNVMEHVPPADLVAILVEGKRIVKGTGLLVHRIDFSDHFSEDDPSISTVNFLRYSEEEWRRFGGNQYNYHNRLRIDEFEALVSDAGLALVAEQPDVDRGALRLIESGFPLDARFAGKPPVVNATASAVLTMAPSMAGAPRMPSRSLLAPVS